MKIVHFTTTPLAGAPFRLVKAINTLTEHEAHLIDLRRYGSEDFGQDVVFSENKDLAIELTGKADVIHFHNYLDYNSKQFESVNFRELKRNGTRFIRQFHSDPGLVARVMGITRVELLAQDIPGLVIGQFQERKYPDCMVVPNIIPENDPLYRPLDTKTEFDIFFSPTMTIGAWNDRWNTKGMPETERNIADICAKNNAKYKLIHKTPLKQALLNKRSSRIVVDEMVTGSYHISGLEGLSQGKPVLSYLDDRSRWIMNYFSGTDACPFINVRLEDARTILDYLLTHADEAAEIGAESRLFVENHWSQKNLIKHFEDVYKNLVDNPELICKQPELQINKPVKRFFACILPDLIHENRKNRFKSDITPQSETERK